MARTAKPATLTDAKIPKDVLARLDRVHGHILRVKGAISRGRAVPTETDDRLEKFAEREQLLRQIEPIRHAARATADLEPLRERVIGSDDILRIGFLARGMLAARSVARLTVLGGVEHGSGFLVSPDALITNNHVLPDASRAYATEVEFELHDANGNVSEIRRCVLAPERFWFTDPKLDFTLVALSETPDAVSCTADLGWHPMIGQQGKIRIGDAVNIIQHPGGRPKSVVLHNSNLLHLENESDLAPFLWYSSDTEPGSSGAPVFNKHWEVIGVHHRSVPRTNSAGELLDENGQLIPRTEFLRDPDRAVWIANQGVRTSRIVSALTDAGFDQESHSRFRDALLQRWEGSRLRNQGQAAAVHSLETNPAAESHRAGSATVVSGPVTISIRIDGVR
jgi:endonuclease G, mitochondrial